MKLVDFQNGEIQFVSAVPGQPEARSSSTQDGVTINTVNAAIEAEPAYFSTGHFIVYSHEVGGMEVRNSIRIETIVPVADPHSSYRAIEDAGARALPSLLRELADALQADIHRADQEREADQRQGS